MRICVVEQEVTQEVTHMKQAVTHMKARHVFKS